VAAKRIKKGCCKVRLSFSCFNGIVLRDIVSRFFKDASRNFIFIVLFKKAAKKQKPFAHVFCTMYRKYEIYVRGLQNKYSSYGWGLLSETPY
jgi:hypothetical protein